MPKNSIGGRRTTTGKRQDGMVVINKMIESDIESAKKEYEEAFQKLRKVREKIQNEGREVTFRERVNGYTILKHDPEYQQVLDKYKYYIILGTNYGRAGAEKRIEKDIRSHYEGLQAKVEKKIGKIKYITKTGNNGYNYRMENAKGQSVSVEVIGAGGYNIQRYHTRWIIKK